MCERERESVCVCVCSSLMTLLMFVMFFWLIRGCLADSCWPLLLSALWQWDVIYLLGQRTDVGLAGVVFI